MSDTQVESIKVLINRIDQYLGRKDTVPQIAKDELILDVMKMLLLVLVDYSARITFLEKYKPWLQALAFATVAVAGALITMLVTGKMTFILR